MARNAKINGDGYTGNNCVFLVGESPGATEDLRNKVFCGDTGVMFRGFIGSLIEYAKEKNIDWGKGVYYTNAVKRFYGKDGHPEKHIEYWKEDFLNEIKQIKPVRILLFGKVAVESLLPGLESIMDYVGGWKRIDFGYGPIPVQICLHPTNVLRNHCMEEYWQRETGRAFLYPPDPRFADPNNIEIINVTDTDDIRYIFENFHNCKHIGYDVEYNLDNDNLYLIGMAVNANRAFVFHENVIKSEVFIEELEDLFLDENITFVAHNWKFDAHATQKALGIIPSVFTDQDRYWADTLSLMRIYDCERHAGLDWAEWLVGLGGHKQKLKGALRGKEARHYERAYREHPDLMAWYNGVDAVATLRLYFYLKHWLTVDGLWETWSDLIGPLGSVFYDMENIGIQIDREKLNSLGKYIDDMINVELLRVKCDPVVDRLEKSGLIEGDFNINSTDHKRILLFNEEFGLGLKSNKMTAKGKLSTDKHVLGHLNEVKDLPVLKAMETYSKLITIKRNYIVKWGRLMDSKGCIHTNFKQTGARTLRIASSDPPVQTIPRNVLTGDDLLTGIRGKLRETIVPHNRGNLLLEMDYSQQELRILARDSGDKEMIRCFVENIDVHRRTAAMITGKSMEEVTDDDRQNAKPVAFGISYGQTAQGLVKYAKESYNVILTEEEADKHLQAFFGLYSGVKSYQVQLIYQAKKEGCAWVWWDGKPVHRRYVHGITSTNKALVGSEIRKTKNCLDDKTEVLTKRGWVNGFYALEMDDMILTKNANTGNLEWQYPTDLKFWCDYTGDMVSFEHRNFSALTTPEHRWLIYNKNTCKNESRVSRDILPYGDYRIHRTGEYVCSSAELSDSEVELFGWIMTDSWYNSKCASIQIFQSFTANSDKCMDIQRVLDDCGIVCRTTDEYVRNCGLRRWYMSAKDGKRIREILPERKLTMDFLLRLSGKYQAELLLRTFIKADGSVHDPNGGICTSEESVANCLQILATLAGYHATITKRDGRKYGRLIYDSVQPKGAMPTKPYYVINVLNRKYAQIAEGQKSITHVENANIWCPIVPNTYFIARRNGHVYCTGNTPIQGGASLYTLNSLLVLKYMQRKNMIPGLVNIVGTVHDSIWFEIEEDKKAECIDLIGRIMVGFSCNTRNTREGVVIPIEVEAKLGPSLGEMKKVGVISSNKIKKGERFNHEVWKTKRVAKFF